VPPGTASTPSRGEAVSDHAQYRGKSLTIKLAVGPGAPDKRQQLLLLPGLGVDLRRDLLRKDVKRRLGQDQPIELAATHAVNQCRALDEIVVGEWKQSALGLTPDTMARASYALEEGGDGAWRAELADKVDITDIDAELERGCRHHGGKCAGLKALLGVEPLLFRQAAMMRSDAHLAKPVRQLARDPLGHASRVDELASLNGAAFDKAYVDNEVAYHKMVNTALSDTLIPDAQNAELKTLLQSGLGVFQAHQKQPELLWLTRWFISHPKAKWSLSGSSSSLWRPSRGRSLSDCASRSQNKNPRLIRKKPRAAGSPNGAQGILARWLSAASQGDKPNTLALYLLWFQDHGLTKKRRPTQAHSPKEEPPLGARH
jgi:hypothetical protein